MLLRAVLFTALLALASPMARADIVLVADPEEWIQSGLQDITQGRTDDFSRNFLTLIGNLDALEAFSKEMRVLSTIAPPAFLEKVHEQKYGTVMREWIYLALYNKTDYVYFKFVAKKNREGWLMSKFEFKIEPAEAFPKDFITR
ncbi:MAG TPA: hypothetical protein VGD13_14835 [Xanthobacteraceae bacterium]|jgi:hypothetical protein